jgi:hypothetical protein
VAIYVYVTATGALYSYCPNDTDPVAAAGVLAAQGLTAVSGLPAQSPTSQWNPATKTVATVAAPVTPNFIPSYQFVMCFTSAETVAIKASTDPQVLRFMLMLSVAPQTDLNSPTVQGGVGYLASIGLIASARVAQVLAGVEQAS